MGYALTPIFFWDTRIEIGTVESASKVEFFRYGQCHMTLSQLGQGKLDKYDDQPGHYLYTFIDGEWFEFIEAA